MAGIYDILTDVQRNGSSAAYREKMIHKVPETDTVDRVEFLLSKAKDRVVLDIGSASGPLHLEIMKASQRCYGIDKTPTQIPTDAVYDLDDWRSPAPLPHQDKGVDLIIAGEVLEHLSNPGCLLDRLAESFPSAQLISTVPNAYSSAGWRHIIKGIECVNRDHVCWYSWYTVTNLLGRSGWNVAEWHWYNGTGPHAEGLVVIAECNIGRPQEKPAE